MNGSNSSKITKQDSASQVNLEGGSSSQGRSGLPNADVLACVLDKLNLAVILTDMNARVLHMNNEATDAIRSKAGLNITHGLLKAGTDLDTTRLRRLIRRAASNGQDLVDQVCHFGMTLGERLESEPQLIFIAGLNSNGSEERAACAVLFATRNKHSDVIPQDILRDLFGLTPAEATLASRLVEGRGVECAAKKSSMGMNTARTHLKKVFLKTQTRRQAELVRLLLRSVGFVKFD